MQVPVLAPTAQPRQDRWASAYDQAEQLTAVGTRGIAAWRATVIRTTGGALITTVIAIASPLTIALVVALGVGAVWLLATNLTATRRGWTRRETRAIALVDLLAVFLVAALTGGTASSAWVALWLAPLAWLVVVDRRWYVGLVALVPVAYLVTLLVDDLSGPSDALSTLALFFAMYAGSVVIGLVILHLRIQTADHTDTLQDARAALLREIAAVQQVEHERFSSQLHDGPLQTIISARQDLEDLREQAPPALELAIITLDEGIAGLRTVVSELYPPETPGDVTTQLTALCARYRQRQTFAVDLHVDPLVGATHDDLLVTFVSELVVNAAKHAQANRLQVSVTDQPMYVAIEVSDDGIGVGEDERQAAAANGHIGLASLDRRVRTAGGSWRIRSAPGRGTTIQIELPRSA